MNIIEGYIVPIQNLPEFIEQKFKQFFKRDSKGFVEKQIYNFISQLTNIKYAYFEYPYVEKIYRDTYYNFFSTKHKEYFKNSMRIAFFSDKINKNDFRSTTYKDKLVNSFEGVITIRPTYPYIFGWTILNPRIIHGGNDITICGKKYKFLINGVELVSYGYPHLPQDSEYLTCAEVSLTCILDYFSKYPNYKSVKPSDLYKSLEGLVYERQLPSTGMEINELCYVLKENGLKTIIYRQNGKTERIGLKNLVGYYIDSQLPIIAFITVTISSMPNEHVCVVIGKLNSKPDNTLKKEVKFYDSSEFTETFLAMDDQEMPYWPVTIGDEEHDDSHQNYDSNYTNEIKYTLTAIIAPLPEKVYLEATKAKIYSDKIIRALSEVYNQLQNKKYITRLFLTSAKSFKDHINSLDNFSPKIKQEVVSIVTARFLWVTEVTSWRGRFEAIIIIDATETKDDPDLDDILVFASTNDCYFRVNSSEKYSLNQIEAVPLRRNLRNYKKFDNFKQK